MSKLLVCADKTVYEFSQFEHHCRTQFELNRSSLDSNWNIPGEFCVSLTDCDKYIVIKHQDGKGRKLEFHELCELKMLLDQYFKERPDSALNYDSYVKEK